MFARYMALILCFTFIKTDQPCNTPLECFLKAYEQIQQVKSEFRSRIINLEDYEIKSSQLISNLTQETTALKQTISLLQEEYSTTIQALKDKIEALAKENTLMKDEIKIIHSDISELKQKNSDKYYTFKEALVYQNIFESLEKGVISKKGNPVGWDDITYRKTPWKGMNILSIGTNSQSNGNGLLVNVPENKNMLWIRVNNDNFISIRIAHVDDTPDDKIEKYSCGKRGLNEMSPDGSTSDGSSLLFQWCPIPLRKKGNYMLYSDLSTVWISGIAFSKNIWNFAKNSAYAFYTKINGGTAIEWESDSWNNDILGRIPAKKISTITVPIIYSGNDKLLYFIEYNANINAASHSKILVNGIEVERLRATYTNPFQTLTNSKIYMRYLACKVPKDLIKENEKFIEVSVDMTMTDSALHIREIGTHDYFYN